MTAPGSGAEIIPFLKTYVNLPAAIGFTVLYTKVGGWYKGSEYRGPPICMASKQLLVRDKVFLAHVGYWPLSAV